MSEPWIHIGRVWTNGEPLLAMDSSLVDAWDSEERFDELVDLGSEATRIPVGGGFAGIIGDSSVNDEGWIEVSNRGETASPSSTSAASPRITRSRMHWPTQPTQMHTAAPSRFPAVNWRCSALRSTKSGTTAGLQAGLHVHAPCRGGHRTAGSPTRGAYRLQVRWRTRVADAVFARWLLSP